MWIFLCIIDTPFFSIAYGFGTVLKMLKIMLQKACHSNAPNLVHEKTGVNSIYRLQYKINCPHTDMMENFLISFFPPL
jgi:hypothetical protein